MINILLDTLHWKIFLHEYFMFSFDKYTSGWQINIGYLSILYWKLK